MPNRGEIVAALRAIAARTGKNTVTRAELAQETGLPAEFVKRRLGRFSDLVRAAGLVPYYGSNPIPDAELLAALREALVAANGALSLTRFARHGRYNVATYRTRWRSWSGALAALAAWLEQHEPDFPHLPALRAKLGKGRLPATSATPLTRVPRDERSYGRPIRFRSLMHAPTTENGVIFLFGAVAEELGFTVEGIAPGFPDCTAKRRLDSKGERWTRVRIEFEHDSRNFRDHGHDAGACDLIVCWQHNWPECPVEVLELRRIVEHASHSDARRPLR